MPTNRSGARVSLSAQTARRNALRGISDKKARGDHKELCSQYDRCVGIFADLSKNSSAISNARRSTVSKAAMSVPSSIATRPARLMPGPSCGRPHGQRLRPPPC